MTAPPDTEQQGEDAVLLVRSCEDAEAFTPIYDRYFPVIHHYVAGRLGTEPADDVAAETFLAAFRQRTRFDPRRGAVRPWLFGIATKIVAQHRRTETRRYRALSRAVPGPEAAESHEWRVVAAVGLQPGLARALASLNRGERDVLLLSALAELSHEEIGQALGISPGTVGSRLSRARAKLRTQLKELTSDE